MSPMSATNAARMFEMIEARSGITVDQLMEARNKGDAALKGLIERIKKSDPNFPTTYKEILKQTEIADFKGTVSTALSEMRASITPGSDAIQSAERTTGVASRTNAPARMPSAAPEISDVNIQKQKGAFKNWVDTYVYSPSHPVLGTIWKVLSGKWAEGIVDATPGLNRVPLLGKIARVAAIGAQIYFGLELFKSGAQLAYQGGNILLDRMGLGAGQLVPPMEMPAAPYIQQTLPPADIGASM